MHADININAKIFRNSNLAFIKTIHNDSNFTFYRRIWYHEGVWTPLISHDLKSTRKETKESPSCIKSVAH